MRPPYSAGPNTTKLTCIVCSNYGGRTFAAAAALGREHLVSRPEIGRARGDREPYRRTLPIVVVVVSNAAAPAVVAVAAAVAGAARARAARAPLIGRQQPLRHRQLSGAESAAACGSAQSRMTTWERNRMNQDAVHCWDLNLAAYDCKCCSSAALLSSSDTTSSQNTVVAALNLTFIVSIKEGVVILCLGLRLRIREHVHHCVVHQIPCGIREGSNMR